MAVVGIIIIAMTAVLLIYLPMIHGPGAVTGLAALIGALVAGMTSLGGALLKYTVDRQAETRLSVEAARNATQAREAEDRLKLEAAIRTVQLLSTDSGTPASPARCAGALFTVSSLDLHELTLALLDDLLGAQQISPGAASQLIDKALCCARVEQDAANALAENAHRMLDDTGMYLPEHIRHGCARFSLFTREWIAVALARAAVAKPLAQWRSEKIAPLISSVALMYENEKDKRFSSDLGSVLNELLLAYPYLNCIYHQDGSLELARLRSRVAQAMPITTIFIEAVNALRMWRGKSAAEMA